MKIKIQVIIDDDNQVITEDIMSLVRDDLSVETLGMSLKESKDIAIGLQHALVSHQIADYLRHHRTCLHCGKQCHIKDYYSLTYRTLFGKLTLKSPRLYTCTCQPQEKASFSPLAEVLFEHSAPELCYLESKWASLMSYGMTVKLLEEVLPLDISPSSVYYNTQQVSLRVEQELGDEQMMYVEGCPNIWDKLPRPDSPLTVGIDGGYVHARNGDDRKAGWFEVIVGKSMQENSPTKRFGFVATYDTKPKRKLYEMLRNQGLQMNQAITFLSDGGDTVRDLQLYLSPLAEHILDWFHVTMRITVMKQMAATLSTQEHLKNLTEDLDRVKWYLWHGNVYRALAEVESISFDLDPEAKNNTEAKLMDALEEFDQYIKNNAALIPNYSDRYHYGEAITTAFVESTVNELVSKRMVKKQQMRWTQKGAHLLLQVRVKTLNNELRQTFCKWYSKMEKNDDATLPLAA
ncbi:TPA: ISKra4 family transposase [Legionella pneumophila]|nr:ISKra4 family transposase [Legionella pneumophila]